MAGSSRHSHDQCLPAYFSGSAYLLVIHSARQGMGRPALKLTDLNGCCWFLYSILGACSKVPLAFRLQKGLERGRVESQTSSSLGWKCIAGTQQQSDRVVP